MARPVGENKIFTDRRNSFGLHLVKLTPVNLPQGLLPPA
jgi:hypothetical protein